MKVLIREQLQDIEITPLGISDLKTEILRQFNETVIRAGTMVGLTAAEATSKPLTQMALNTFQTAGSSKNVSHGVERISELINATKEPKKSSCSIYFKNDFLSFDDIIVQKRPEITEITVKDLVIGRPDVEKVKDFEEPFWYEYYRNLIRDDFKANDVLRLDIDTNMLYAYKLTMEDVCRVIEKDQPVICVFSPITEGKIDIYPIEKSITSKLRSIEIVSSENASLIFLSMVVVPALDKLKISGISGIQQIYPVEAPVWQIVKEEIPFETNTDIDANNGWFLILNPIRMKITGISVEKLVKFCQVCGMNVTKIRPNYISVQSNISPTKRINEIVKLDMEDEKEYEKKKKEEGARIIRRPPTEVAIHSKLIYADSTGSNLKELMSRPDIDSTRTYCNNVHEIVDTLGIEAGRTFLIKEFIDVLSADGGYLNPRHIVLLVDYMSSLGKIYGVTFTGISRQPIGALEKSSFEKAMEVFKEASGFGEEKSVSGTSASIFIGKKALVGTGYSSSYIKPENLKRYHETRKELNSDVNMTLDVNTFNDAIEQFVVESGSDVMLMEGLEGTEEEMFGIGVEKEPVISGSGSISISRATSVISETVPKNINDKPLVKGKVVRSAELEEVASEFNNDLSCVIPTTIPKEKEELSLLAKEMEKIAKEGKPSMPLPLPSFSSLSTSIMPQKPKPKPVAIFNLEDFLTK